MYNAHVFMKHYEIMTIYDIDLSEDEVQELSQEVQKLITSMDGEVIDANFWGRRKFAYEINGKEEGYYDVVKFDLDSGKMSRLKSKLNLMDNIVRYLISALEKA